MDAVEYLKAITYMHGKGCFKCPLAKNKNGKGISCGEFQEKYPEETVEIVEEYWKKNKPKTNAEWVKEQLEKTGYSVNIEVLKCKCPVTRSVFYAKLLDKCPIDRDCTECRAWWDKPYEEKNG